MHSPPGIKNLHTCCETQRSSHDRAARFSPMHVIETGLASDRLFQISSLSACQNTRRCMLLPCVLPSCWHATCNCHGIHTAILIDSDSWDPRDRDDCAVICWRTQSFHEDCPSRRRSNRHLLQLALCIATDKCRRTGELTCKCSPRARQLLC